MKVPYVRNLRLLNQQISNTKCIAPEDVVKWLVAMQAQEFRHAKWAIGLRLQQATDDLVENAFNAGAILRTHLMRPTWHFVTPEDIRWLLALTAPRVHAGNQPYYRKFELTKALLRRTNDIISRSLEGGKFLIRNDLQGILKKHKVIADGPRLAYIMMHAELEQLICSGPRIGKQFSYALLDERVPQTKVYHRDEALSMFLVRYFNSRGPATLHDFTYWSGLTLKDATAGIEPVRTQLDKCTLGTKEYYAGNTTIPDNINGQDTFLMPDYDEYAMSYKDRTSLITDIKGKPKADSWSVFGHHIVVEGTIQGSWKDEVNKNTLRVSSKFIRPLSVNARKKVNIALERYSSFLGKNLERSKI